MSRTSIRRLVRLEKAYPEAAQCHLFLGRAGEDDATFESRLEAFRALLPGYWKERDTMICVRFVSPAQVRAERAAA